MADQATPLTQRGTVTLDDHQDDSYGQCAVCRVYVPHTDEEYLSLPFPCPTVILARRAIEGSAVVHGVGLVDKIGIECLCQRTFSFGSGGWVAFNAHLAARHRPEETR